MSVSYTELVPTPPRTAMNTGFSPARHSTMLNTLGVPCPRRTNCSPVTNARLRAITSTRDVGPFRVTGINPALDSLQKVFSDVQSAFPGLYDLLGTAGMSCCRAVRGNPNFFSNHSWGTAIDLTVGGILAPLDAARIPHGLLLVYPFFHRHGWFWAAGYNGRTDPMHFEVANETILQWQQNGLLA